MPHNSLFGFLAVLVAVLNVARSAEVRGAVRDEHLPTATTISVDGKANIFAAGRASAFGGGVLPSLLSLPAGSDRVVTITGFSGAVGPSGSPCVTTPDGDRVTRCTSWTVTDINSYQGISGIIDNNNVMFLVGVFLDDNVPSGTAPTRIDVTNAESSPTVSPQLRQTFFIGDGRTGTNTGDVQQFIAPSGATRLFLGFADGDNLTGDPSAYGDNVGSFSITLSVGSGAQCPPRKAGDCDGDGVVTITELQKVVNCQLGLANCDSNCK